jgi:hypothetical protein
LVYNSSALLQASDFKLDGKWFFIECFKTV